MSEAIQILANYRFERAREALREAELLLAEGHTNTFVNRLYYACFYAVSALLLLKGKSSAKHSGIRAIFHQEVVRPGLAGRELGQLYDRLYDNRQKADYADMVRFSREDVAPWLDEARALVAFIGRLIAAEMKN